MKQSYSTRTTQGISVPSPSPRQGSSRRLLPFVLITAASIHQKGVGGYFKSYFRKPRWMFPIHIIEEITKPLTLALRLFGNLFSGGIMIALLISFIPQFYAFSIIFTPVWKLFDMFIGVIQAFIFALLTILYFDTAMSGAHERRPSRLRRMLVRTKPISS